MTHNRGHRLIAASYDTMTAGLERQALAPRRERLVGGLTGEVLDVGAGTGVNLQHLQAASRLVAVEPDPAMRTRLTRRAVSIGMAVELLDAAAESLPFRDAQFDGVLFTLVLCTVADPHQALTEARRVLKPTGHIVVIEHVRDAGRLARWQDRLTPLWRLLFAGDHLNRDTRAAIEHAGFHWTHLENFQPMPAWIPASPMICGTAVPKNTQ
jgi:ubiquinone/menaquinone biosynthesis C-methylase UbiE